MDFKLKKPCDNCPFRTDIESNHGWLGEFRAKGIIELLYSDHTFPCHKTANGEYNEDYEYQETGKEQHCYGALVMLINEGTLFNNFLYRLAVISNMLDDKNIKTDLPIVANSTEFIKLHSEGGFCGRNSLGKQHKKNTVG